MGYNKHILSGHSLAASFNSSSYTVQDAEMYSLQLAFTGSTCSFSAKIQTSDELTQGAQSTSNPTNWDDLPNSSQTFTSAGTFLYNVSAVGYASIRLVVTDNSTGANTGTLSVVLNVKGPL